MTDFVMISICHEAIGGEMKTHFGRRLQRLMELRGLKQKVLATGSGVAQSSISRLLHNANSPTMETILKISAALDVPLESLTHPNDIAAEIIYELHFLEDVELSKLLEHIRKEKLWKARQMAQSE